MVNMEIIADDMIIIQRHIHDYLDISHVELH